MMLWIHNAELKAIVSKKDFLHLYQRLLEQDKSDLDMEVREQIVYFADMQDLSLFSKQKIAIRFRRSNRWLEVVVKKRGVTEKDMRLIQKHCHTVENHTIKIDIDQVSDDKSTVSCSLRYIYNSMHQSFAFLYNPHDLLTDLQKDFLGLWSKKSYEKLRFLIPIQSKTFVFPYEYKEFEAISLEEWRMPHIFGNKFYEITLKTIDYNPKKTYKHFLNLLADLDITPQKNGMYKTQWLYDAYFNV